MSYVKINDISFLLYMERKYKKKNEFSFIDDYLLWLYEEYSHYIESLYYQMLERDIKKYCSFQSKKMDIFFDQRDQLENENHIFNFYVSNKYNKKFVKDQFFNFLYKVICQSNLDLYYWKLEKELICYVEKQTGKERNLVSK